ncbi:MAG: hypothetical protein DMENIID0002_01190 [Rickettsia endosymbiont of Sergentomyia squamirostris]|uniref:Leucine Rich repeat family protein n=1 Tax=Candidatus Tisiphia endosymbiont of Sergentomyia squamirostris TaxID=3113639 RepID=A0AAT9G6S6_9RICK
MKELEGYLDKEKGIIDLTGYERENWKIENLIQLIQDNQNVTILKLADTDISCEDLQLLIQSGALNNITELDLSNNALADGDMSVIPFDKQFLSKVTIIRLCNNCMENDDVEVIVQSNLVQQLTILDLSGNEIENEGAESIANADFENLIELNLASNSIGDKGSDILTSKNLLELIKLNLSFNAITDEAMNDVYNYYKKEYGLENLEELYIGANSITAEGVRNLVDTKDCFENLHTLSFDNVDCGDGFIRDEGVKAIVNSEGFPNLTNLSFAAQEITDTGVGYIVESKNLENLEVLDIQYNNIHDEGMRDIITSENLPALKKFCFGENLVYSITVMLVHKWGVGRDIEISFDADIDPLLKSIYTKNSQLENDAQLVDDVQLMDVMWKLMDVCVKDKYGIKKGVAYVKSILDNKVQYPLNIDTKDSQGRSFDDLDTQYSCLNMCLINRFPDHTFPCGDHTALLSSELLGSTISDGAEH